MGVEPSPRHADAASITPRHIVAAHTRWNRSLPKLTLGISLQTFQLDE
jgi:hypothetical protein